MWGFIREEWWSREGIEICTEMIINVISTDRKLGKKRKEDMYGRYEGKGKVVGLID